MSRVNDGGPAFAACNEADMNGTMGMSLRDYFAAGVIAALVAGPDEALGIADGETVEQVLARHWLTEAKVAYLIADAMIAAREVKP